MFNQDLAKVKVEATEDGAVAIAKSAPEARSWLGPNPSPRGQIARISEGSAASNLELRRPDAPQAAAPAVAANHSAPSTAQSAVTGTNPGERVRGLVMLAVGVAALVFLLPVLLAVGLAVWVHDGGPVLFAHRRVGLGGRSFYCFKFRSMARDAEQRLASLLAEDEAAAAEWKADHKLRNDPRVTRLGKFLRKTSLDELPQLFNVLRGEMSLVGPRPIVDGEIAKYGRHFRAYCAAKPGITGLWQVSGRNDTSYRTRVALDTVYARRQSTALDLWILARTIPAVLARKGSY